MAREPWCYTPDQIARITFVQAQHLYINPAAEVGRKMESRMNSPQHEPLEDRLPTWAEFQSGYGAAFVGVDGKVDEPRMAESYRELCQQWQQVRGGG